MFHWNTTTLQKIITIVVMRAFQRCYCISVRIEDFKFVPKLKWITFNFFKVEWKFLRNEWTPPHKRENRFRSFFVFFFCRFKRSFSLNGRVSPRGAAVKLNHFSVFFFGFQFIFRSKKIESFSSRSSPDYKKKVQKFAQKPPETLIWKKIKQIKVNCKKKIKKHSVRSNQSLFENTRASKVKSISVKKKTKMIIVANISC